MANKVKSNVKFLINDEVWLDSAHGLSQGSSSNGGLTRDDLEFLQRNTSFDKETILDFYKGFIADVPEGKLRQKCSGWIILKCIVMRTRLVVIRDKPVILDYGINVSS